MTISVVRGFGGGSGAAGTASSPPLWSSTTPTSTKLARTLAKEMARQDRQPDLFVQVNTGEEPQKAGVLPLDVDDFILKCRDEMELPVVGLMCIPPVDENPALHFALLSNMAARNGLERLSMGMSADYETAVRLGATEVRIGTAIFGKRPLRP